MSRPGLRHDILSITRILLFALMVPEEKYTALFGAAALLSGADVRGHGLSSTVVGRESEQALERCKGRGSLPRPALDDSQVQTRAQLDRIVTKNLIPQSDRLGVVVLSGLDEGKISGGEGVVGISGEGFAILLRCFPRVVVQLVKEG